MDDNYLEKFSSPTKSLGEGREGGWLDGGGGGHQEGVAAVRETSGCVAGCGSGPEASPGPFKKTTTLFFPVF